MPRWQISVGTRSMIHFVLASCLPLVVFGGVAPGIDPVRDVPRQPLEASVQRLVEAMKFLGEPLPDSVISELQFLRNETDDARVVASIQTALDARCLAVVSINPESRVKVAAGPLTPQLIEKGWRNFLVKVVNEAGVTAPLRCNSPQANKMVRGSSSAAEPKMEISPAESNRRWLDIAMPVQEPMLPNLSGLEVEYRVVQLYSRDAGPREATLQFDVGQGTQDLGFRSELPVLFRALPSQSVALSIRDHDGKPTTCALLIQDPQGRVYPNPARRLAPDFFFHPQIYRADGETVTLPAGTYRITATRGPEYLPVSFEYAVSEQDDAPKLQIQLQRWVHMANLGWFSGDHHVHAAGCAHYENPTQGVTPEDMMRHIIGEDLNIGCVLSWGPCWYHQKQFFDGKVSKLSRSDYLMRYDVEVSGFPSSHAGHLCLLNLVEDDYPNTQRIEDWPSWTVPILKWGQSQGGIVGYSHSGWGLALPDYLPDGSRGALPGTWGGANNKQSGRAADRLPDYAMPPFDGIGANEYIVASPLGACDFISTVDTPAVWELNIWYHTLNCGLRSRISGETDFPCIYGERVGLGRIYVELDPKLSLSYNHWVQGLLDGRSFVGDGLSQLTHFRVNDVAMGHPGSGEEISQLDLAKPGKVTVTTRVAAMLPEKQSDAGAAIQARRLDEKPYWHLERSRIQGTRDVPVELIVNGEVAAKQTIAADGNWKDLQWEIDLDRSSWIAIRIFPSLHTNPIFVEVADRPIRVNRRSAEWCRRAVDVCWEKKRPQIREAERDEAEQAYDQARGYYDRILAEIDSDTP
ncbi:MAG: CehA/McbA family metallohydrolase [Planctomycetota bacterium]